MVEGAGLFDRPFQHHVRVQRGLPSPASELSVMGRGGACDVCTRVLGDEMA